MRCVSRALQHLFVRQLRLRADLAFGVDFWLRGVLSAASELGLFVNVGVALFID